MPRLKVWIAVERDGESPSKLQGLWLSKLCDYLIFESRFLNFETVAWLL